MQGTRLAREHARTHARTNQRERERESSRTRAQCCSSCAERAYSVTHALASTSARIHTRTHLNTHSHTLHAFACQLHRLLLQGDARAPLRVDCVVSIIHTRKGWEKIKQKKKMLALQCVVFCCMHIFAFWLCFPWTNLTKTTKTLRWMDGANKWTTVPLDIVDLIMFTELNYEGQILIYEAGMRLTTSQLGCLHTSCKVEKSNQSRDHGIDFFLALKTIQRCLGACANSFRQHIFGNG